MRHSGRVESTVSNREWGVAHVTPGWVENRANGARSAWRRPARSGRGWRLYLATSALDFEAGRTHIQQVLAAKSDVGASGLPVRPRF